MNLKPIHIYSDGIGVVEYVDHCGSDLKAVNAARNSYYSKSENFEERDEELLKFLLAEKHNAVLEHNTVTFHFVVPIFVARQHMRHRTWSYNEVSRRYTSTKIEFFTPSKLRIQDKKNKQMSGQELEREIDEEARKFIEECNKTSFNNYQKLLKMGVCREQARGVLVHNLYTSFWGTANLRNILHFITLRKDAHAQQEVRVVAAAVENICNELYPVIMREFRNGGFKSDQ